MPQPSWQLGHEDYRWPIVRTWMSPLAFQLFNLGFIAIYQNWLLMSIAAPAYVAYLGRGQPINAVDVLATVGFLAFFALEVVADEQQWVGCSGDCFLISDAVGNADRHGLSLPQYFQIAKHAAKDAGLELHGDQKRGFLTQGLFTFSRCVAKGTRGTMQKCSRFPLMLLLLLLLLRHAPQPSQLLCRAGGGRLPVLPRPNHGTGCSVLPPGLGYYFAGQSTPLSNAAADDLVVLLPLHCGRQRPSAELLCCGHAPLDPPVSGLNPNDRRHFRGEGTEQQALSEVLSPPPQACARLACSTRHTNSIKRPPPAWCPGSRAHRSRRPTRNRQEVACFHLAPPRPCSFLPPFLFASSPPRLWRVLSDSISVRKSINFLSPPQSLPAESRGGAGKGLKIASRPLELEKLIRLPSQALLSRLHIVVCANTHSVR